MHLAVFFQAEDGIRDVERSRGLGDVYKRQLLNKGENTNLLSMTATPIPRTLAPVSYTHLTLPTILRV